MKLLVTGGAGFIGSNFVHYMHRVMPDVTLVTLDLLTYAGNLANLAALEGSPRHRFVLGDITNRKMVNDLMADQMLNRAMRPPWRF